MTQINLDLGRTVLDTVATAVKMVIQLVIVINLNVKRNMKDNKKLEKDPRNTLIITPAEADRLVETDILRIEIMNREITLIAEIIREADLPIMGTSDMILEINPPIIGAITTLHVVDRPITGIAIPGIDPTNPDIDLTTPDIDPTNPDIDPTTQDIDPTTPDTDPTNPDTDPIIDRPHTVKMTTDIDPTVETTIAKMAEITGIIPMIGLADTVHIHTLTDRDQIVENIFEHCLKNTPTRHPVNP